MGRLALFLGLLSSFAAFETSSARAESACAILTDTAQGSRLHLTSPIVNRSGKPQPATLGQYCGKTSPSISPLVWVQGTDGQLYNLKSIFAQAEVLTRLSRAETIPPATPLPTAPPLPAPPPPPPAPGATPGTPVPSPTPLTWENDFQQQFTYLQTLATSGRSPCATGAEDCLDFAPKLDVIAAAPPLLQSRFNFPIGDMSGGQNGNPRIGVVISSVVTPDLISSPSPSPSPGASAGPTVQASTVPPELSETTTLTAYLANHSYQVVAFTQTVGLGRELTYTIAGHLGPGEPTCDQNAVKPNGNYQDFCTAFSGGTLALKQSNTEGGDFTFCSPASIPIPGAGGLAVVATGCKGLATLAYDVDATPVVGYARIVPNFNLTLYGSLTANAVVVQGEAKLELTLAKIDNSSAGFIYGIFNDPFHRPTATILTYRPFAYYEASALPLNLTLSIKTIWGWKKQKTYAIYSGFSMNSQDPTPLDKSDWFVTKVLSTSF